MTLNGSRSQWPLNGTFYDGYDFSYPRWRYVSKKSDLANAKSPKDSHYRKAYCQPLLFSIQQKAKAYLLLERHIIKIYSHWTKYAKTNTAVSNRVIAHLHSLHIVAIELDSIEH